MQVYDTIIIGSGIGGLTAGLCLSRAGQKVLILEKHYVPGGWCHSFYINGHRFSPGVHYVGLMDEGQSTQNLFRGLGVANDLTFFKMNTKGYEHFLLGEEKFDIPNNFHELYLKLSYRFPKEKKGLKKYLNLVEKVYAEIQLIPKMKGFWDHITIPYRTRHLGKYGLFSLKKVLQWYIKDPLLRQVLSMQCGDHGLSSNKASFPLHCALMCHYAKGGFYPMGGGAAIVKALTKKIKFYGGEIMTQVSVEKILSNNINGRIIANGVVLKSGEVYKAKHIISNTDPSNTFKMIESNHLSKKLINKVVATKYSVTSLLFFVSVAIEKGEYDIDSGNIWKGVIEDEKSKSNQLTEKNIMNEDNFSKMFISCSSMKDPTSYNGIHHTLEVIVFVEYDEFSGIVSEDEKDSEKYKSVKKHLCNKMSNSLDAIFPGMKNRIDFIELGTPFTNQFFINSTKGNVYGTEKSLSQSGPFGYQSKTEIKNLFLCGASTISHGVAGASYSGVKAASAILECDDFDLLKAEEDQKINIYDCENPCEWPEWIQNSIKIKHRKYLMKN